MFVLDPLFQIQSLQLTSLKLVKYQLSTKWVLTWSRETEKYLKK